MKKQDLSKLTIQQLKVKSAKENNPRNRVNLYLHIAQLLKQTDGKQALEELFHALKVAQEHNLKEEIAHVQFQLAQLYNSDIGDYSSAMPYAENALQIFLGLSKHTDTARTERLLGDIYLNARDFVQAGIMITASMNAFSELGDVEEIAITHLSKGALLRDTSKFNDAVDEFRKALRLSRVEKNQAMAHTNLGTAFFYMGKFDNAILHFQNGLKIARTLQDLFVTAGIFNNLASVYVKFGDLDSALQYFQESYNIKLQLGQVLGAANVLANIGAIYYELKQFNEAQLSFQRALDSYILLKNEVRMMRMMKNIGMLFLEQKEIEEAERYLHQAFDIGKNLSDDYALATLYCDLSQLSKAKGEFNTAREQIIHGIDMIEKTGKNRYLLEYKIYLIEIEKELGNIEKSIGLAREILADSTSGDLQTISRTHIFLSDIFEKEGNYRLSLEHFKAAQVIKDKTVSEHSQHKINTLLVQFDVERMRQDAEINKVKAEQLEKELLLKKKELNLMALHLVNKNEFLTEIKGQIGENVENTNEFIKKIAQHIDSNVSNDEDWQRFEQQFTLVNPTFSARLMQQSNNTLTSTELKICALIKTGLSSQEIANILFLSKRTIENHRYHIQKKLNTGSVKLTRYLLAEEQ